MPFIKKKRKIPLKVEDLMTTPPITAPRETPIEQAAKTMYENNIGSLIIVDPTGRIEGIVTERDILYAVAEQKIGKQLPVYMIMTENPITVKPGTPITEAIKTMRDANIRHLPVVDRENKPIGILSLRDIIDAITALLTITI